MCGIYGLLCLEKKDCYLEILNGLKKLQNRGYDSAGISILSKNNIITQKFSSDKEKCCFDLLEENKIGEKSFIGIGHNRWATHGAICQKNSHPFTSQSGKFCLVHNGIIENFEAIKTKLKNNDYKFYSDTDSEVIVNLIDYNYSLSNNVELSINNTIHELKGTFGLLIISVYDPNSLFIIKRGSPIVINKSQSKIEISSESSAFSISNNEYYEVNNNSLAVIVKLENEINIITKNDLVKCNRTCIEKSINSPYPYPHFTIKEIYQQPECIGNALNNGGRFKLNNEFKLGGIENYESFFKYCDNIIFLGCGTSFHSGCFANLLCKKNRLFKTSQVIDGAEFNEFDLPLTGKTCCVLISQSGETADLIRCVQICKNHSSKVLLVGIINVVDSLLARETDCGIYINSGQEFAVASTKAFTSQCVCLNLLIGFVMQLQENYYIQRKCLIESLTNFKSVAFNYLKNLNSVIDESVISLFRKCNSIFLLGKGFSLITAKEGSLKIKEITYIHSEAYSSSALKHGPFALLSEDMPVIIINCDQEYYNKTINAYYEIKSRGSPVLLITNKIENIHSEEKTKIIKVPSLDHLSWILALFPIQILAYKLSILKGINPDKPKNLAKVVSVE